MKLLILGGTRFVGRHLTEAALADGHEVTLFNRGQFDQESFPTSRSCAEIEIVTSRRSKIASGTP